MDDLNRGGRVDDAAAFGLGGQVPSADATGVEPDATAALPAPRRPIDPVAVLALIAVILLLPVVALVLGYWSRSRIRRDDLGGEALAGWARSIAWIEVAVTVAFWTVYFLVLAPVVTLPR
ncbi:hypothetical protein ACFSBZ_09290 [Amnibacterium flavum]|uniref:DUF4190 domain-containing protein n=1 Tax=Amnibacterium flavum TaxID=2173173 RepID=A0A2V1HR22_9MICO|nr:hypothetical protein [Amnibacterium flavum]PVZ95053.1 hypothetical protein DDQ50_00530 [Amnibacterium flavum]